ncbi:MAG: hypothetical protein ACR2IE_02950 [Candidatus Sumerlaeaceae bacterium]
MGFSGGAGVSPAVEGFHPAIADTPNSDPGDPIPPGQLSPLFQCIDVDRCVAITSTGGTTAPSSSGASSPYGKSNS